MRRHIFNNHGFAVVYGLVILLLVSVGGTALLFIAQKDRVNASDYSRIRSTTQAANAALKACEGQFQNQPDIALAILKKYKADPTYKYILNASDAAANVKTKYPMDGAGSSEYIAEIKGFDQDKQIVLIEGTGFGGNGGKKKVLASYQLEGLTMVTPAAPITGGRYGLYIAKDGESFNWAMTVTGNVYFGGTFIMQSATGPITINGNLKTGISNTSPQPIQSKLVVSQNAYFQCPVSFQNAASTISGKAGFERPVTLNQNLIVNGDSAFSNSSASGTGKVAMLSGKTFLSAGTTFPSTAITGGTWKNNGGTITGMGQRLGFCEGNEGPVTIDITKIPVSYQKSYATVFGTTYATLTAAPMNTYCQNNPSQLWNGFLVIKIGSSESPQWSANPGTFNYKAIWILDARYFNPSLNYYFYNSGTGTGCNTLIYITNGAQFSPCGWTGNLRGYIYVRGTGNENVKIYNYNQTLIGGINIASTGNDPYELTGPTSSSNVFKVNYDESVIQEFVTLGLCAWPTGLTCGSGGGGGGGTTPVLTLVDKRIRPKLLSRQM